VMIVSRSVLCISGNCSSADSGPSGNGIMWRTVCSASLGSSGVAAPDWKAKRVFSCRRHVILELSIRGRSHKKQSSACHEVTMCFRLEVKNLQFKRRDILSATREECSGSDGLL
jgi:hypothetical protein